LIAATALCLASCHDSGERRLKDTEGRSFKVECEGRQCAVKRLGESSKDETAHVMLSDSGRLVGACNVESPNAEPRDWDCRALECEGANDCPPLHGLSEGECLNGLCIDPANPLGPADAVMLCLAGTGLGRKAPMQVERYALALNCGNPCRIPKPCRQP
jgi:hypothetical protein